jgi:acetylornithine deacetylase
MGRVLVDLETLGQTLSARSPHQLLGTASIHASLIEGGQELSSYPEHCRLHIERRTVPGETTASVLGEVEGMLMRLRAADPSFSASADLTLWREPFEVSLDEPLVAIIRDVAAQILGAPPPVYGDTPWMDAALLSSAGIPTVVFGPGGAGAHAAVEYASITEVGACAGILARAALQFCDVKGA